MTDSNTIGLITELHIRLAKKDTELFSMSLRIESLTRKVGELQESKDRKLKIKTIWKLRPSGAYESLQIHKINHTPEGVLVEVL